MSSPELAALLAQLWPTGTGVVAHLGRGACPAGHRTVEAYDVLPGMRRPRFLVPRLSRRAAAASLLRYNRLRGLRTALSRAALAAGVWTGAARPFVPELRICATGDSDEQPVTLTRELAERLDVPALAAGIGVRPVDPNSKPTLQLFDVHGTPRGYAKIGWNDATRTLVTNEARALQAVSLPLDGPIAAPALAHAGSWQSRGVVVTAPLPAAVRRHGDVAVPPPVELLRHITGPGVQTCWDRSGYLRAAREQLDAMAQDGAAEDLAAAAQRYLGALLARRADADLLFGRWHGDWVPWNLGWLDRPGEGAQLWVWDWEHSAAEAPVGFDIAHWHFQVAFVLQDRSLAEGLAAVRRACAGGWPELGVPAQNGGLVADLYLLELALRTYRLFAGGGGWHPRLYPDLLTALTAGTDASTPPPAGPTAQGDRSGGVA